MERMETNAPKANWDINALDKSDRSKIRNRLVARLTHDENEYRAVLSYLHMKFPDLMDVGPGDGFGDGRLFQWRYHTFQGKVKAYDQVQKVDWDMYALVYYDPERDMEPVAVGGSYLRETGAIRDPYTHAVLEDQVMNKHTTKIRCGHGYVLFVDPSYRRMGLARDQWITEAQLYRDSNVHYQKENQTYAALQVTLSMFGDVSKCHVLSGTPLERVREGMNTKIIMDYFDDELVAAFNDLPKGLLDFRGRFDETFLKREGLTVEQLVKPWNAHVKKVKYQTKVPLHLSVDRDLYEAFRETCNDDAERVKTALIDYMRHVAFPK